MDFRSGLYRGARQQPAVMTAGAAFADSPAGELDPVPEAAAPAAGGPTGPVGTYQAARPDPSAPAGSGVWWQTLGLWVEPGEHDDQTPVPRGARTFTLEPVAGTTLGSVHAQTDGELVHVLVTSPGGDVLAQATAAWDGQRDLALVTLATLAFASGAPTGDLIAEALVPGVLDELAAKTWDGDGWSCEVLDLPGRVVRALGA